MCQLRSLKNSATRTKEQALAIYLAWMKTGIPQETLASFFGIDSRQNISHFCNQVRAAFVKDFVLHFLGSNRSSRDEWLCKNTEIAKNYFQCKRRNFV